MHFLGGDSVTLVSSHKGAARKDVIVIARHGRPALSRKIRLTANEYRLWWKKYDEGGLAAGEAAPERLKTITMAADVVYASTLLRARETAQMARGAMPDAVDAVYIEAALPPPALGPIKFRPRTWGTLSRICWFYGFPRGEETVTATRKRAKLAAGKLEAASAGGKVTVLFAHGWFNRMIGTQLRRRGWKRTVNQGDLHWKFRQYERRTDKNGAS